MNIQDFYRKTASISLNASVASLVPPFFILLFGLIVMPNRMLPFAMIPFLIYSLICYHDYLLNDQRSKEIHNSRPVITNFRIFDEKQVLITFMPAPSLRMLLFNSSGQQLGEIRDLHFLSFRWFLPYFIDRLLNKKYGIYDEANQLLGSFTFKRRKIAITDENFNIISKVTHKKSGKNYMFELEQGKQIMVYQSSLYTDCQIYDNNILIARLRRGWMPLHCGNWFKDPNTPVLTFQHKLSNEDKLLLYAILAKLLSYSNH
ncbi:hypothetical protein [Bacillus sp. S/N-304-OC-R1]|uniref:hypothetical protein n=1 Tax=Bacillus sp. S/N-304-OC-R1 TaxID=2758034 RepID=UPI001C8DF543|nr:hypothetical protein [Bacillus sp. S/N-304-OC-R1]MBY0124522.1 hypothetical protein [Bacillus sp. S/N-304-OC-R1]